jgi:hypothetical protein
MANAKQYFVNKLSRIHISIVHGIKLFSKIIGDIGILGRQINKSAASESPFTGSCQDCACLKRAD